MASNAQGPTTPAPPTFQALVKNGHCPPLIALDQVDGYVIYIEKIWEDRDQIVRLVLTFLHVRDDEVWHAVSLCSCRYWLHVGAYHHRGIR